MKDLRLPEDLVGDRFWVSEHFKFLSKSLWLLHLLLQTAHKCVKHHLEPQSVRAASRFDKILVSVKLSYFSPSFVSLLVGALLFSNSCKSKLIGSRSIWKLFAKAQKAGQTTDTKGVCACNVFLHYFISPKVRGGRSEYKRLSFIGSTLGEVSEGGDTLLRVVTLIWRPADILCQHSLSCLHWGTWLPSSKRENWGLFGDRKNLAPKSLSLIGWWRLARFCERANNQNIFILPPSNTPRQQCTITPFQTGQ